MTQAFGDLEGVEMSVDDILVWGATVDEHDEHLKKTLQRCEEINLTLNKEKCEFRVKEVTYISYKLTPDGVKPDERKVEAIKHMPPLEDKKGGREIIGHSQLPGKVYTEHVHDYKADSRIIKR